MALCVRLLLSVSKIQPFMYSVIVDILLSAPSGQCVASPVSARGRLRGRERVGEREWGRLRGRLRGRERVGEIEGEIEGERESGGVKIIRSLLDTSLR